MFKVGDIVKRKKEHCCKIPWTLGSQELKISGRNGNFITFDITPDTNWNIESFELVKATAPTLDDLKSGTYAIFIENNQDFVAIQHILFKMKIGWHESVKYKPRSYDSMRFGTTGFYLIIEQGSLFSSPSRFTTDISLTIKELTEIYSDNFVQHPVLTKDKLKAENFAVAYNSESEFYNIQNILFSLDIGWKYDPYMSRKYNRCAEYTFFSLEKGVMSVTHNTEKYPVITSDDLLNIYNHSKKQENETNRDLQPIGTTEGSGAVRVQGKICKTAIGERFTGNKISLIKGRAKIKSSIVTGKVLIPRNY